MHFTQKLEPCRPPLWAREGHLQTILGYFLPSPPLPISTESIQIKLPDGDCLAVNYYAGTSSQVIYLLHGLAGDAASNYIRRTILVCQQFGHSVYAINHRGCGAGKGLAQHPYHSGRGEDLSEVIKWGRERYPQKKHTAIGFSLGANALLTLLTGLRGDILPDVAIAVNAPIDLTVVSKKIQEGLNRMYDFFFVLKLRAEINKSYSIPYFASLWDFDNLYTAPAGGFKNGQDYYDQCSTQRHLHRISIPTLLLTSADDPFIPSKLYSDAKLSSTTHLHIEKHGGHIGYLTRASTPLGTNRWLDYALMQFLKL